MRTELRRKDYIIVTKGRSSASIHSQKRSNVYELIIEAHGIDTTDKVHRVRESCIHIKADSFREMLSKLLEYHRDGLFDARYFKCEFFNLIRVNGKETKLDDIAIEVIVEG